MNTSIRIIIALILLVGVAAASFYAGTVYGEQQALANRAASFANRQGALAAGANSQPPFQQEGRGGGQVGLGNGQRPGGVIGQIDEVDGNLLTVIGSRYSFIVMLSST